MADGQISIDIDFGSGSKAKASADSLARSLKNLGDKGEKSAKGLSTEFKNFGSVLSGVLAADALKAGLRALGGGIASITTDFANLADQTIKTADKLGVGVVALQELRFAAGQSGIEANTFDVALQRLTRRAAEAAGGTGVAKAAFEQLGIQLKDTDGNVKKTEDIFGDLAGAFQGVESQSEKVRLAFQLFDTEGVALVNLLDQGEEGLAKFSARAKELGFAIGEDAARQAERFNDAQAELSKGLEGVRNEVASRLLPTLTQLTESLTDLITENRELFSDILAAAPRVLRGVTEAVIVLTTAFAVGKIRSFAIGLKAATVSAGGLVPALKAAKIGVNAFKAAATLGLTIAIDLLVTKFLELQDEFGSFGRTAEALGLTIAEGFLKVLEKIPFVGSQVTGALATVQSRLAELRAEVALTPEEKTAGAANYLGTSADAVKAEAEQIAFERRLAAAQAIEDNAQLKEIFDELSEEDRKKQFEILSESAKTEEEIQIEKNKALLAEQQKSRSLFLQNEKKFGSTFAKISEAVGSERVRNAQTASRALINLQQSENSALKAIGKAAALTQIGIDTARAAISAYSSLAGIPLVGPALGAAAAGAVIAFGVEQAGKVLSAQDGGQVPFIPGSNRNFDSVPAILQPGEVVVPTQNFDQLIEGEIARRGGSIEDEASPPSELIIRFADSAVEMIEAELIQRQRNGISLEPSV